MIKYIVTQVWLLTPHGSIHSLWDRCWLRKWEKPSEDFQTLDGRNRNKVTNEKKKKDFERCTSCVKQKLLLQIFLTACITLRVKMVHQKTLLCYQRTFWTLSNSINRTACYAFVWPKKSNTGFSNGALETILIENVFTKGTFWVNNVRVKKYDLITFLRKNTKLLLSHHCEVRTVWLPLFQESFYLP